MFIVLWLISDRRVWQKQGLIVLFRAWTYEWGSFIKSVFRLLYNYYQEQYISSKLTHYLFSAEGSPLTWPSHQNEEIWDRIIQSSDWLETYSTYDTTWRYHPTNRIFLFFFLFFLFVETETSHQHCCFSRPNNRIITLQISTSTGSLAKDGIEIKQEEWEEKRGGWECMLCPTPSHQPLLGHFTHSQSFSAIQAAVRSSQPEPVHSLTTDKL